MISPRVFHPRLPRCSPLPQLRGWLGDFTAAQQVCPKYFFDVSRMRRHATFARAATPDMLFTATIAAAMACGAALIFEESPGLWHRVGFGFFLGAATLAKGPAAVVLAGGAVALWAAFSRKWTRSFRLAHPLSVFVFFLTALPWYFLCARRNPDFLNVFIFQHNFERFLTPVFHHVKPWWFFPPILVLWILPWSAILFALGLRAAAIKEWRERFARPGFYFACWTIFVVIFFSASKSKLPGYILPAVPALVLLLAAAASRIRCNRDDAARGVTMGLGATWLALVVGAGFWLHRQPPASPFAQSRSIWYFLAAAAAGGAIVAVLGSAHQNCCSASRERRAHRVSSRRSKSFRGAAN